MKTTKFVFASTVLAAVLLSSACTLIYDLESSDTLDDTSSEISESASSNPKESSGNSEESSINIGVSKPVSSSAEESSDKPEDSKPESSGNLENDSSTTSYEYVGLMPSEEEATSTDGFFNYFDFTYIRYQQPVLYSSLDDPDMLNWDFIEGYEHLVVIENPDYFRVKSGDKLENGLTFKSARSIYECSNGEMALGEFELSGKINLEGILYCETYNEYSGEAGVLHFLADAAKSDPIPLVIIDNQSHFPDRTDFFKGYDNKFMAIVDGPSIKLGLIDESPIDLSGIISPGECIRAKISVSNLIHRYSDFNESFRRATLVSLEKLPD